MFLARHHEGPLAAEDVSMAAPKIPHRLFYAPVPPGTLAPATTNGYMLVSYDQPPERDWEGQVEYVLDRDRSELRPHASRDYAAAGMEEGTAVYVPAE